MGLEGQALACMKSSADLMLVFRTVRYLRPVQVAFQIRHRLRHARRSVLPFPLVSPRSSVTSGHFLGADGPQDGLLSFLNDPRGLEPDAVNWAAPGYTRLWRYNLQYFDYLGWKAIDEPARRNLIESWIAHCPPGTADAWEPYTISLRVVNWLKYWIGNGYTDVLCIGSAAQQLAFLEKNVEYHLLANHLLKNGKALVFGGIFFEGPDAARWLRKGLAIMLSEADEQVLPDGGHFERSPMYHGIVLEDYLDVVNLARSNPGLVPNDALDKLASTARRAAVFLADITAGDGRIPLLNDAAFGITREPADLLGYARRVLEDLPVEEGTGPRRIHLPDTGYFGYRQGGDSLILDCGPIGPDYQPGHAHCDTLSYELCVAGERVVVDTGVYSYEADATRQLVRSTAAHNTVRLDGAEQSEIWAAFRVGRRARPLVAELGSWQGGQMEFRGAHDGYRYLPGRPLHERRVVMHTAGRWEVFDLISGGGDACHRAETFVHLNSTFEVEQPAPGRFLLRSRATGLALALTVTCGSPARVEQGYYFPEFGLRENNYNIVIERQGPLPLEISYRIERLQRAHTVPDPLLPPGGQRPGQPDL